MLPKTYLSCLKLENIFARKHGLSYSSPFFRWASEYPLFLDISDTCLFFQYLLFLLYFCIAPSLFATEIFKRDIHKNLEHLFGGILSSMFLSKWKACFLRTPSVGAAYIYGVYVILILGA